MTIPTLSRGALLTVGPEVPAVEAAKIMAEHRSGALVVMDDGELVGVISERDIALKLVATGLCPDQTPVGSLMTSPVISVRSKSTIRSALRLMVRKRIRHLPLLDPTGEPVAMLSMQQLLLFRLEQLVDENRSLAAFVQADGIGG